MPRRPARWTRLLAAVAVTATALATGAAVPAPAGALVGDEVDVVGRGWGHGRGMGQWGALGYAVDHGWDARRILDHYYGGTTMGTQPDGLLDVRLVARDDRPMVVTSRSPFTIGSNTFAPGETARVTRLPGGEWEIARGAGGCAATAFTTAQVVDGRMQPEAVPASEHPGSDLAQMLELCGSDGTRAYRGRLRILWADGATRTVNRVWMEDYLRGVVPRESPASWASMGGGRGIEALKAQAVAARSYAWGERRSSYAQTCDTISCQVYGGAGLNGVLIEHPSTDRAIVETAGLVRRHADGSIARTEFSSSTGGWTAGGTFPAVEDLGDAIAANPHQSWRASIPVTRIEARYPQLGPLRGVEVARRSGLGPLGGRALTVVLHGPSGQVSLTSEQARSALGIKSGWFAVLGPSLSSPAVAIASSPSGEGAWVATAGGGVYEDGDAERHGDVADLRLTRPVVGMARTPGGGGYWLVAGDGGVFSFGDARFFGSTGGMTLNRPVVGMAPHVTDDGYWFVASDGGVFSFGEAAFHGSAGSLRLNQPVVAMAATATGGGYWLLARDGGIFAYGDAPFLGSMGGVALAQPVVGMTATPTGRGYWMVAADGGVFTFGDAPFLGSKAGEQLPAPVVGIAATPTGQGYRLLAANGSIYPFGDAR